MINRQMEDVDVWEKIEAQDEWGAPTDDIKYVITIKCAINHVSGTNIAKDINYSEITHLGLTATRGLKRGYVLQTSNNTYLVEKPPNECSRLTQLYLKEVV